MARIGFGAFWYCPQLQTIQKGESTAVKEDFLEGITVSRRSLSGSKKDPLFACELRKKLILTCQSRIYDSRPFGFLVNAYSNGVTEGIYEFGLCYAKERKVIKDGKKAGKFSNKELLMEKQRPYSN